SAVLAKHEMRMGLEFLGPLVFRMARPRADGMPAGSAPPAPPVPFVWTLHDTLELCEASGPSIGVTLDAWHWYHSEGTVGVISAAGRLRIRLSKTSHPPIMLIVHVFVHVIPEAVDAFKAASLENARNSVQEPGVVRFDVVQQDDDPTQFLLMEIYRDAEAPA